MRSWPSGHPLSLWTFGNWIFRLSTTLVFVFLTSDCCVKLWNSIIHARAHTLKQEKERKIGVRTQKHKKLQKVSEMCSAVLWVTWLGVTYKKPILTKRVPRFAFTCQREYYRLRRADVKVTRIPCLWTARKTFAALGKKYASGQTRLSTTKSCLVRGTGILDHGPGKYWDMNTINKNRSKPRAVLR